MAPTHLDSSSQPEPEPDTSDPATTNSEIPAISGAVALAPAAQPSPRRAAASRAPKSGAGRTSVALCANSCCACAAAAPLRMKICAVLCGAVGVGQSFL